MKFKPLIVIAIYSISVAAIYYTDSRGALVGILIFIYLSIFGLKSIKYLLVSALILFFYFSINYSFQDINSLSSNRISIWVDILNQNINPSNSIDSSFIFFGYNGLNGLILIFLWTLYSLFIGFKNFGNNIKYLILILTLGVFDLGLFSFSNLVGLHCWAKCLFNEKNKS
jgi:hypothetical protein